MPLGNTAIFFYTYVKIMSTLQKVLVAKTFLVVLECPLLFELSSRRDLFSFVTKLMVGN